jgi:hypothetical protein
VIPQSAADMHVKLGNIRIIDIPNDLKPMPVSFILRASAQDNTQVIKFRKIFTDLAAGIDKPS